MGSCLTLRNELSEETHVLINQSALLGRGIWVESSRVREHKRMALLPHGSQSRVLWWWCWPSGLSLASHLACVPICSDAGSFLVAHASLSQDGSSVRISGRGSTYYGLTSPPSSWPLPNSPSWFFGSSTTFLIGTSCCETTHVRGTIMPGQGRWFWSTVA